MNEPESIKPHSTEKHKRKGITPGLRFDILSRDGFKCRYCGVLAQDAKLVIDHVIPVKHGGITDPGNLITACQPCNQGKSAKLLSTDGPSEEDENNRRLDREKIIALAEHSTAAFHAAESAKEGLFNYLCGAFGLDGFHVKTLNVLFSYLKEHGQATMIKWIDIAAHSIPDASDETIGRYISGIRKKELSGEVYKKPKYKTYEDYCNRKNVSS